MAYLTTRHEKKEGNVNAWLCRKCSRSVTTLYEYTQGEKRRFGRCRDCSPEFINQHYDETHDLVLRIDNCYTTTLHYGIDYMIAELIRIGCGLSSFQVGVVVDIVRKLRPFLSPSHHN